MARFERIKTISLAVCLGLPAEGISAASRFEAGTSVPVQSRALLDFTIVIPEFVWLKPPVRNEAGQSPEEHGSLEEEAGASSWSATGNGSPIVPAFFPTGQASQSLDQEFSDNALATFTVASP